MAVKKYLDKDGVSRIADYVNGKLTVVSAIPASPTELRTILYIGPTTEDYTQGGIYLYDVDNDVWILISTADVNLDYYETSWTGTQAEWDDIDPTEQAKYQIVNITDDYIGGSSDHVVNGYYYNGKFYEEITHTTEITAAVGYIYIDIPNGDLYLYDETLADYVIVGGGGFSSIAWGYYYQGSFYEESTHTTVIDPVEEMLYIDLGDNSIYIYKTNAYVQISGKAYTAGYGVNIDSNMNISTKDFVGTFDEWNNLTPEEQSAYDSVGITDDFIQNTDVEIAYVDDLPTSNIKDIIYGHRRHINTSYTAADGFLDSDELFQKTITVGGYVYTPAEPLQAGTDGVNYGQFESLEYDGTKFILTFDDGTFEDISIGEEFYYRYLGDATYYVGSALDQALHLLYDVDTDDVPTQGSQRLIKSGGVYNALATKANSANTIAGYHITDAYTKEEVDNKISELETNITWKAAVPTYNDIATTYPNPQEGWTVVTTDTNIAWRYSGGQWIKISANTVPDATTEVNGLMTTTMVTKLNSIASGAEVNQNAFSNVKVGNITVIADGKTDTLELAGSNVTLTPDATNDKVTIGITKANVTTALGYTPPTSDTNTHRPIQMNGSQILGDNTTALNLKAGSNVSLSNSSGTVTIAATDTNTWRGIQNNLTSTSTSDSLSAYQGKVLNDGKAPNNHASTATTYGRGNASYYGHVKLSDTVTSSVGGAADGIGLSQAAAKWLYDDMNTQLGKKNNNLTYLKKTISVTVGANNFATAKVAHGLTNKALIIACVGVVGNAACVPSAWWADGTYLYMNISNFYSANVTVSAEWTVYYW